jgi:hypothetical protein
MASIKLRRLKANTPDEGRSIQVVWQDIANPLRDENGVIRRSEIMNAAGTALIPYYPEFGETVAIPNPAPTTQEAIDALIAPALENVKIRAQVRANNTEAKTSIRTFVNALNQTDRIDFEGTVTLP